MPNMDGFEATAAIRENEAASGGHIPFIAMTANAMKGDRERCLEAGMDGYVSKPVQLKELFEAVEAAVPGPAGNGSPLRLPSGDAIDRETALARMEGDEEHLKELASIFLEEYAGLVGRLQAAADNCDRKALERAAHSFKGSLGVFAAGAAVDAAQRLESMAATGDMASVSRICIPSWKRRWAE